MADREIYEREVVRDDGPGRRSSGPIYAIIAVLVLGVILAIALLGGDDDGGSEGDGVNVEDIEVDVGDDG